MAEAATEVETLLENLGNLLRIYQDAKSIKGSKKQIEDLESNLRLFKAFLNRHQDEKLHHLALQIRDVVYKAADVMEDSIARLFRVKSNKYFGIALRKPVDFIGHAEDLEAVCAKMRDINSELSRVDFASLNVRDGDPEESEVPHVRQENVFGFSEQVKKVKEYLSHETEKLDVISITGVHGIGKTTLAGEIFRDPDIQYEFAIRIWVNVSSELKIKDIFVSILKELTKFTHKYMYSKGVKELAQLVADILERSGKFLIVMDDVWKTEDWDELKIVLPNNNNMGKVLITSHQEKVARYANPFRLHKLRRLTQEGSWLLLQYKVFGKPNCCEELRALGELIASQCDGLPLAVVIIGGILAKKHLATMKMSARINVWEQVARSLSTYLDEDSNRRMEKIISLAYYKLSYHLKACFLYLGMFPKDFEIPVWKLFCLWIAEGFIQEEDGVSLEEAAENCLNDLIDRNLVIIDKRRWDGRAKTCRVHDMVRDFCKTKAERENIFQEMKNFKGVFQPPLCDLQNYRRLCISSKVLGFFCSEAYAANLRSFLLFCKDDVTLERDDISMIFQPFKLMRVLDFSSIRFRTLIRDLFQLVHLRYLVLSVESMVLPSAFSKFQNIQTLIVDTPYHTLEIKADIWDMIQLRHFKTNASANLPMPRTNSQGGKKLRTLGTISTRSCNKIVFDRACNLKKLSVRGRLGLLMKANKSFDSLGKLGDLEILKLHNDIFRYPPSVAVICGLPPAYKFPPKLRSLTLSDTLLEWSDMYVLGSLENLEVLKLKDRAFMGERWKAADGGFCNLKVLHIERTNLIYWLASSHHFPRLRHLKLRNCEELQEIPIGLAAIPSFQLLELYHSKHAAASANKIREEKQKKEKEQNVEVGGDTASSASFLLTIIHP